VLGADGHGLGRPQHIRHEPVRLSGLVALEGDGRVRVCGGLLGGRERRRGRRGSHGGNGRGPGRGEQGIEGREPAGPRLGATITRRPCVGPEPVAHGCHGVGCARERRSRLCGARPAGGRQGHPDLEDHRKDHDPTPRRQGPRAGHGRRCGGPEDRKNRAKDGGDRRAREQQHGGGAGQDRDGPQPGIAEEPAESDFEQGPEVPPALPAGRGQELAARRVPQVEGDEADQVAGQEPHDARAQAEVFADEEDEADEEAQDGQDRDSCAERLAEAQCQEVGGRRGLVGNEAQADQKRECDQDCAGGLGVRLAGSLRVPGTGRSASGHCGLLWCDRPPTREELLR